MDSHLIAGVYFQQFQQAQEISLDNDRVDAINKAKRLSQETNRRRKLQLHKRQLQAKREEQRRHDILTRRKEEQRLATEKYQRSHLPPSARQNYRPMARAFGGTTLETALQLIRGGNPHNGRPVSSHERFLSLAHENVDLLESSFNKLRPHSTRPGSGRLAHQLDPKERAELMNYSKQNLTASKTLFEQELEQQQSLLREQHQHYLQEFNNAVNSEIHGRKASGAIGHQCDNNSEAAENLEDILHSDSCSSVDSLDEYKSADVHDNKFNNTKHVMSQSRHLTVHVYHEDDGNINKEYMNISPQQQKQEPSKQQEDWELEQQQQKQILTMADKQNDLNNLQQRNINSFTLTQKNGSLLDGAHSEIKSILDAPNYVGKNQSMVHVTVANDNGVLGSNKVINGAHEVEQNYQQSLKQVSADSLDSDSSSSNISVLKLQGIAEKTSKASSNMYLQNTGNGNTFSMSNTNSNGITGINPIMYRMQHSENNNFSGQTGSPYSPNIQTKPSQVAWVSPSQIESKANPTSGNENKQANEHFQLHAASGISTWSGNSTQSQKPMPVVSTNGYSYNSGGALMSTTMPASFPARFVPNSSIYTLSGSKLDAAETRGTNCNEPSNDLTSAAGININMNNDASYLDIMNSTFPQTDPQDYRNISSYNQKQVQIYNCLSQTNVPAIGIQQADTGQVSAADKQMNKQSSPFQNGPSAGPEGVNSVMHQDTQHYHRQWMNDNALTSTTPSYAGRNNFPVSRPPSPVASTAIVTSHYSPPAVQTRPQPVSSVSKGEIIKNTSTRSLKHISHDVAKENIEGNPLVDDDSEDMRPLRGILKQNHAKNVPRPQETAATGRPHVRDSLELAHLHNDKKSKKKSVRFASRHDEDDNEDIEDRNTEKQNDINAGLSSYKTSSNRPLSTRTMSASNSETDIRVQRALSAGSYRQQSMVSEHVQIRNVQQLSSSSHPTNSSEVTNAAYTNILQERSNLPTSFVNPINTTPIHRPKAAAHIIMSTDTKNEASKGHNDTYTGPPSAYRSNLETIIRPVNNNFMSKVPVKIPASKESNTVVCNVAYTHTEGIPNNYTNKYGGNAVAEDSFLQVTKELSQQQNFDKPRNAYSSSKHVSFSNLAATASMVPASQKSPHPHYNGGSATFATSSNNVGYEKGGIRVDRTPTDDEITWLWDKVRNCLSRESGNKTNLSANGNSDLSSRQPPTVSTKLIDGNTLELGAYNSGASDTGTNVKAAPGVFQPQTVPVTNPQNSVKAVSQPQGSYLRRYSLLKQRRANSASAIRNTTGSEGQRASGTVYGRNSTIPAQQTSSVASQQQQQDIPPPMMYGYKPQNEVSESTAAFIIAERLAKQSLSDSQIQIAMEDAQSKQEAYNRSRMTIAKNGHTALSIEEQKLLESLDRLNEKLKEPHFKTSVNQSQATQTQFPGFQGHRPIVDARRHTLLSPTLIQRAQSARSRQQTYLYR